MKALDAYRVPLDGLHLIEASAGTGKTHAIATLYLRAVVELGLLPEQILVVTFTRAATGELGERVRARLRQAQAQLADGASDDEAMRQYFERQPSHVRCQSRIERALLSVDQAAVMTIHGFCSRVLDQNAFENRMPFDTELVESIEPLLDEVVNDFVLTRVATLSKFELLALRSAGFDGARLSALARVVCRGDRPLLEPDVTGCGADFSTALRELELRREIALRWLGDERNVASLGRLNKSKPREGIGKRVAGLVDKSRTWLSLPFHELTEECVQFVSLKELADKHPVSRTPQLLSWFASLDDCTASFERLRQVTLWRVVELQHEFVEFLGRELDRRKQVKAIQSYDDLLRRLRDTLQSAGGPALVRQLRQRYPVALIDEFQDTDPVQFEVFSSIYREQASLFLIGDPKQSIYAFRGADVDSYLTAKRDPRVQVHTLAVNWRSDPRVLAGLDLIYRTHPDPFISAGIDFASVSARPNAEDLLDTTGRPLSGVRLLSAPNRSDGEKPMTKERARRVAIQGAGTYVARLLTTTPAGWKRTIRANEVAVLTRTNRECLLTARALALRGIRCVQTSDSSVLQSDAAASLRALLRALIAPSDSRRLVALLVDPLVGLEPAQVQHLRDDIEGWEGWVQRLLQCRRIWERSGALSVVVWLSRALNLKPRLLNAVFGERYLTDLMHSAELVQSAARQQHLSPEAQLVFLERGCRAEETASAEEQQLRIEADSDAVLVTTVHRAKGLQFPFVVCPFFWSGSGKQINGTLSFRRKTDQRQHGVQVLHLEPRLLEKDGVERRSAELDLRREEARLLYVALTRAKHQVSLIWVDAQGSEHSPLHRLLREESPPPSPAIPKGTGVANREHTEVGKVDSANLTVVDRETTRAAAEPLQETPRRGADEATVLSWHWRSAVRAACAAGLIDGASLGEWVPGAESTQHSGERGELVEPWPLERVVEPTIATTSYSALTATFSPHSDVGRDVDAVPMPEVPTVPPALGSVSTPAWLAELPRGAKTGEALHAILEYADFCKFGDEQSAGDVSAVLERFGLDPSRHELPVRRALRAVMDHQLVIDNDRLRLRNVDPGNRRSELEFIMQVSQLSVERLTQSLNPGVTGLDAGYHHMLGRLHFNPVSGYLRGFIDLVFELDGRYYVVDYKSNALGDTADCYTQARIEEEMRRHHYPVQAAIYAAAVDRWLLLARSDYDYEAHFGGVLYLFLRGMVPQSGPASGVFFHRPGLDALRDFEAMLEGRTA